MSYSSSSASPASITSRSKSSPKQIHRRHRPINSCFECRRRKAGCSKNYPCTNCVKFSRTCIYGVASPKPAELVIGSSTQHAQQVTDDLLNLVELESIMHTASGEPAIPESQHDYSTSEIFNYARIGDTCLEVGKLRITQTRCCMLGIDILKLVQ